MKRIFCITITMITVLFCSGMKAQETFFPTKEGVVLTYQNYDKKGKTTGMLRYTITKITKNGQNMDITYLCESLSSKKESLYKEEITIHQEGDKMYFDFSNMLNKGAFAQEGEIPANLEISVGTMEIPVNLKPGDELPDANLKMSMKMGFINMNMSANMTNRKVESIEDITVKAGNFNCYKLTCDTEASVMGAKAQTHTVTWYSKGIGSVKQESYDKKGKLESSMELCEISGL